MKSFKDDYYSNLEFIKEISNGISYLPIIPTVYNVQLLKIMMPEGRFPDITDKKTNEEIFSIFSEIKNFLQKCAPYEETVVNENRKSMQEKRALNCFLRREEAYFRTISNSQIVYSIRAVNYIYHKDYNKALYYFAKCVEDEGTGLNKKKCISVSEYAIYFNITYLFFMIIEQ